MRHFENINPCQAHRNTTKLMLKYIPIIYLIKASIQSTYKLLTIIRPRSITHINYSSESPPQCFALVLIKYHSQQMHVGSFY